VVAAVMVVDDVADKNHIIAGQLPVHILAKPQILI
jgi:hypothetical protein